MRQIIIPVGNLRGLHFAGIFTGSVRQITVTVGNQRENDIALTGWRSKCPRICYVCTHYFTPKFRENENLLKIEEINFEVM